MPDKGNAPIIVKRKKIVVGGGHHGGAWKVAYADFVTAMMAFFLLMWLLGATTEKQRKSIADYFNPTVPIVKASGGGNGAFGGESMSAENTLSQQRAGAAMFGQTTASNPKAEAEMPKEDATEAAVEGAGMALKEEKLDEIKTALLGVGGEAMQSELLRRHIVTRLSDEGLVIELFDVDGAALFDSDERPTPLLRELLNEIVPVLKLVENGIATQAHTRSVPIVVRKNPNWDLSALHAQELREGLEDAGLDGKRITRVTGFADRQPVTKNPMDQRNQRLEIVVLRKST